MLHLSRVLHATDFSPSARKAMQYSILLAKKLNVPLDILHVVSGVGAYSISEYIPLDLTAEMCEADRRLAVGFQLLGISQEKEGPPVRLLVGHGPLPGPVILEEATSGGTNLIVLGAHGSGTAKNKQVGSVATDLIRRSTCPLMVIPEEMPVDVGDDPIKQVVIFVTFRRLIDPLLLFAAQIARLFEAHLDVLTVTNGSEVGRESSLDSIEKHLWRTLEKHVHEFPGPIPVEDVQLHSLRGDSIEQVLSFTRDQRSDLLIMEAPGLAGTYSPIERAAEDVVARASCPVMLLNVCGRVARTKARSKGRNAMKAVSQ